MPGDVAWTMAPAGTNTGEPIQARSRSARRPTGAPSAGSAGPGAAGRRRLVHARLPLGADGRPARPALRRRVPALRPVRPRDGEGPRRIPSWYVFDSREGGPAASHRDARGAIPPRTSRPAPGSVRTRSPTSPTPSAYRRTSWSPRSSGSTASARPGSTRTSAAATTSTTRSSRVARARTRPLTPCDQAPSTPRGSCSPTSAPRAAWSPTSAAGCCDPTALTWRACTPPGTRPRPSSAPCTWGRALRSAPPWSSRRWRCGTSRGSVRSTAW